MQGNISAAMDQDESIAMAVKRTFCKLKMKQC
jgi:hypothetical protein